MLRRSRFLPASVFRRSQRRRKMMQLSEPQGQFQICIQGFLSSDQCPVSTAVSRHELFLVVWTRQKHVRKEVGVFPQSTKSFHTIHLDLVGLLRGSHVFRHCLKIIGRVAWWSTMIRLKDISTQSYLEALCQLWIPRFGVPIVIITEQAIQFESTLFRRSGDWNHQTIASHPQASGRLEKWNA